MGLRVEFYRRAKKELLGLLMDGAKRSIVELRIQREVLIPRQAVKIRRKKDIDPIRDKRLKGIFFDPTKITLRKQSILQ